MYYICLLILGSFWLYLAQQKIKTSNFFTWLIVHIPVIILYLIPLWLQEGIGTDYESYYSHFGNSGIIDYYNNKNEYLYSETLKFANFLGHPQFIFVILSSIQSLFFFYTLYLFKKKGYETWLIFFLFITATGIYHNQTNGLRQFVAVNMMLFLVLILTEKKYIIFALVSVIGFLFHNSFIVAIAIVVVIHIFLNISNRKMLLVFILSIFIFSMNYLQYVVAFLSKIDFLSTYIYLAENENFLTEFNPLTILSKLFYVPLLIWCFVLLRKNKLILSDFEKLCIKIVVITYFFFIQGMYFQLFMRVWQYFNVFIIVVIYLLIMHFVKTKKNFNIIAVVLYVSLFYFYKVLIFAKAEYSFNLIDLL